MWNIFYSKLGPKGARKGTEWGVGVVQAVVMQNRSLISAARVTSAGEVL